VFDNINYSELIKFAAGTSTNVLNPKTKAEIGEFLHAIMDVILLRRYKIRDDANIPKTDSCIVMVVQNFVGSEFLVDELAEAISECALEECRVHI